MQDNSWKKALILETTTIFDTIKSLEKNGQQICLILNKNMKIVGILNDGDLRRAVLGKINLSDPVKKIMNKNPILVNEKSDKKKILSLMEKFKITQIPVINSKKEVKGLVRWDQLLKKKTINNSFIIMSGGLGKRMRPLTNKIPKPLLKIKSKPIIQHIIEKAEHEGFTNFIVSINYLGHKIKNFIKRNKTFKKVKISFIHENKPLGTAGSLGLLKKNIKYPIIVINGDVITDVKIRDILDFHNENKSDATMAVKMVLNKFQYGVVQNIKSKIINLEEKPINYSMVNAGLYILNPKVLKYIEKNKKVDMTTLFSMILKKKLNVTAFPIHEKWHDVGSKKKYFELK